MGRKIINLLGQIFGKLTVVAFSHKNKKQQAYWKCKCECGKEKIISSASLISKHTKSCGCKRTKIRNPESSWKNLFYQYKRGITRGRPVFNLNYIDFKKICSENCFYCGDPPFLRVYTDAASIYANGIDRVDNNKGYETENIRAACFVCNKNKSSLEETQYYLWISKTYKHLKEKGLIKSEEEYSE